MARDKRMADAAKRRLKGSKPWRTNPAAFHRLADQLEAEGVSDPYRVAAAKMAKKKK